MQTVQAAHLGSAGTFYSSSGRFFGRKLSQPAKHNALRCLIRIPQHRKLCCKWKRCSALLTSSTDNPDMARHHPVLDVINDSTKWSVSAVAFGTLLLRRDVTACWCIMGSVVAAFNCRLLKYAINQSRPEAARKADPGMPSSHANSLAFLSTYVAVAAAAGLEWHSGFLGVSLVLGVPAAALFLTWLRVVLGYHTTPQVAVGWVVGASSAAWWWHLGQTQLLPSLQQHPSHALWLYGITCGAVAFFVWQNVARWVRERQQQQQQQQRVQP